MTGIIYNTLSGSEGVNHTYLESPGVHDWTFWNEYIEKAIMWALNN